MGVKITAAIKLNHDAMERVKRAYMGAPAKVHAHRLSVGVHEYDAQQTKTDYKGKPTSEKVIDAAYFAEFGIGQPQRSWLRTWFDSNVDRLKKESTEAMRAEFNGDPEAVLLLARKWSEEIREGIVTGTAGLEALSPATQAERERAGLPANPPLFATGQLVEAIHGMADAEVVG